MAAADVVRINGRTYGWGNTWSEVDGVRFLGLNEWKWDEKLDVQFLYHLGQHYSPYARPPGKYVPDPLTYNVWSDSVKAFNAIMLAAGEAQGFAGSVTLSNPEVLVAIGFTQPGLGDVVIQALDCELVQRGMSGKEGPEGIVMPMTFSVKRYVLIIDDQVTTLWNSDETGAV